MKNALFYLITVLIWGSTWLGIKFQLGVVDPVVSVTYRFALASALLLLWCAAKNINMRFSLRQHGFMLLQGTLLFGFNYLFFYEAELYVTSGLAAVLFSSILVMNIVNGALLLGSPIDGKVVVGGTLGLIGIALVFLPEISHFSFDNKGVRGVAFCVLATLFASWGNITSARNQRNRLPIIQSNAYGMAYGALMMFAVASISRCSARSSPSAATCIWWAASAPIAPPIRPCFSPWSPSAFRRSGKAMSGAPLR
jgi:drug/metabolite transporter (DMT)-like permease